MAATELRTYQVTIPAGTAVATPLATVLSMPPRIVDRLEVRVPPGPNGSVGWAFTSGGQRVFPFAPGTWVVTDNETVPVPTEGAPEGGKWELTGYNTGRWDHTLYIRAWLRSPAERRQAVSLAPLDLEAVP